MADEKLKADLKKALKEGEKRGLIAANARNSLDDLIDSGKYGFFMDRSLLSSAIHDVRSPLTSVKGFADMLQTRLAGKYGGSRLTDISVLVDIAVGEADSILEESKKAHQTVWLNDQLPVDIPAEVKESLGMIYTRYAVDKIGNPLREVTRNIRGFMGEARKTNHWDDRVVFEYSRNVLNGITMSKEVLDDARQAYGFAGRTMRAKKRMMPVDLLFDDVKRQVDGLLYMLQKNTTVTVRYQKGKNSERDNPDTVNTDKGKLVRIFVNLISNALKYTKGDTIDVGYKVLSDSEVLGYLGEHFKPRSPGGDWGIFSVKDYGPGIKKENLDRLFAPYFRFNQEDGSTCLGTVQGIGLGLNNVAKFAQLLGGKAGVESEFGVGSRFYVVIPIGPNGHSNGCRNR